MSIWEKKLGPPRKQGGRALEWSEPMQTLVMQCLSHGIEATSINNVLQSLSFALCQKTVKVPSVTQINHWRGYVLPAHIHRQTVAFVEQASTLTVCLDCASFRDHKISGIGLVNQNGEYHLADLYRSLNRTADELVKQVKKRFGDLYLMEAVRFKTRALMGDQGSVAMKAAKTLATWFNEGRAQSDHVLVQYCSMHTGFLFFSSRKTT